MILDEVLYESSSFDMDDMVDIFTEGFLFALEMQEAGYKAGSTEELSKRLVEAADIAIGELSDTIPNRAAQKAQALANRHARLASMANSKTHSINNYHDTRRDANFVLADKYAQKANRINDRISRKNLRKGYKGIY